MTGEDQPLSMQEVRLRQGVARVHVVGEGAPLLLVHGGWGGASFHWQRVVPELAQRHRVIVPELPGLGAVDQDALSSVADYARWLVMLLDALDVQRACVLGNSFGGSVAWAMAGRDPARVSALVLVDGFAMPATPRPLHTLGQHRAAQGLLGFLVRHLVYTPRALPRAFADVHRAPASLHDTIEHQWPLIVPRYVRLLIEGDGSPTPRMPMLLLWGTCDRLPGSERRAAERLHASLPTSTLTWIEDAGHFPQVEQPTRFVAALETYLARHTA